MHAASEGIRFVYEHPNRTLRLKLRNNGRPSIPTDVTPEIDVMVEGNPRGLSRCNMSMQLTPCR
jgi:hypothetical protein